MMIYKEEYRDLFSVPKDYALCHCISSDFAMGAGIAKEFTKRGVKEELLKYYVQNEWCGDGYALLTFTTDFKYEINLVTKKYCWEKPTLDTLKQALKQIKNIYPKPTKIAMPRIGCGLDRLNWKDVSEIIKDTFKDTDIEILVCVH